MSCRPDDVMSRAIFEVRAFLAGPASHVGSTALLPRIITTIGIGPRLSLAFVGSPLLPLISATSGSWPRWGGRGHVFSIPTLPERGSPMIFDPPWVTVLPDSDSLERFLADPAEHTGAGAVELRLDFWASPPSLGTIASIPVPSIVTWRRGAARESERLSFLKELLMGKGGDLWLDLDVEDPAALRGLPITIGRPDGVRVLMSRHFEARATDAALRGAARNLLRPGVDAAKLVVAAGGLEATLQALRLSAELSKEGRPIVVFAAGIGGTASRFLAGGTGRTWWGYGRTRGGTPVVAGQPVVATIGTRYGGGLTSGPSGAAGFAAVIGSDVSRSLSPGFHNRALVEAGRPERWLDLTLDDPSGLLADDLPDPFPPQQLAITAPHKSWARRQGRAGAPGEEVHVAWNTLAHDARGWVGWNTDVPAFLGALENRGVHASEPVLIIGAGGTARPIALELARRGTPVWILRRGNDPLPEPLAEACVTEVGPEAIAEAQVLVNATGTADRLAWPIERFRGSLAVEYRYDPLHTDFSERTTAAGAALVDGLELFAEQARRQSKVLYDLDVSVERAREWATLAHHEMTEE